MKVKKILAFLISAVMAVQSIPIYASVAGEKIVESELTEPDAKDNLITETIIYNENEFFTDDTIIEEEELPMESGLEITEEAPVLYANASVVASGYCGGEGDGTNLTWKLDANGALVISGYGEMEDYSTSMRNMPWYIYANNSIKSITIESGVTSIGDAAFYSCMVLTDLSMAESIKDIGYAAFQNCYDLTKAVIPSGVETIAGRLFYNCSALQEVTLPETIKEIGMWSFYECGNLRKLKLPDNIENIGRYAFHSCENLMIDKLPSNLRFIGDSAFGHCNNLTGIVIPKSVVNIYDGAFRCCENLTSITVENGNTEYCSVDGVLFNIDKSRLVQYPSGKPTTIYEIPDTVIVIGNSAFEEAKKITNIVISDNVETIRLWAFSKCSSQTLYIPDSVSYIDDQAFLYCRELTKITVSNNNNKYSSDERGVLFDKQKKNLILYPSKNPVNSYKIPNTVNTINEYAFYQCDDLKTIYMPKSVVTICEDAFGDAYFIGSTKLVDVYYSGDENHWSEINIEDGNDSLISAKIHYNSYDDDIISENPVDSIYTHFGHYNGCTTTSTIDPVTGLRMKRAETATIDGVTYPVASSFEDSGLILDKTFPGNWLDNYYYIAYNLNDANEITSACVMEGTVCQLEGWDPVNRVIDTDYTPLIFVGSDDSWRTLPLGEYYVSDLTLDSFPINEIGNWVGDDVRIYWAGETIYKIIHITYGSGTITAFDPLSTPQKVYIDNVAYSLDEGNDELVQSIVAGQFLDVQYILYDDTIIAITSISESYLEVSITNNGSYFVGDEFHVYFYDCTEFSDGTVLYSYPAHWLVGYDQYGGNNVVQEISSIKYQDYHEFIFKALAPGTAVLHISDYTTKESIDIALTIAEDVYKSYRADNVPQKVYDIYVEKDYYNYYLSGMYLADFTFDETDSSGYVFDFKIFNESFIPGVVEVYNADGTLKKIYPIDKYKEKTTSLLGTGEYIVDGVVDLFQGDSLSFRGDIQSKESNYAIEVPQDGYILVTNSGSVSEACFLMNVIDLFWEISSFMMDTAKYNPEMVDDIVAEILRMARKNEFAKEFLKKFMEDFAKESASSISAEYLLKLYTNISKNLMELFTMLDIDFAKLGILAGVSSGMGVLQDLLVKASGPAGIGLDVFFHLSKITNLVTQVVQWCKIDDNSIGAVIYTPRADATNTIHNTKDGISATLNNGSTFSANTILQTYQMTGNIELTGTLPMESTDEYVIYSISLVENGDSISFEDKITVQISRPSIIGNVRTVLQYIDNEWIAVPFTVSSDIITVQTSLLGEFAILGKNTGVSGTCGDNATWTLTKDGTLTISGTGAVYDYTSTSPAPWYSYRNVIKQVIVDESVERLGSYAFLDLANVKNFQLAEGLLGFDDCVFHNCRSLETIFLPSTLEGDTATVNAFQGCTSLKNVYIPSSNPWYESIDGVLFGKLNHRLQVYPAGRTEKMYVVPEGTLGITGWAFADCTALEQVILPESVTALYVLAFMDCTNLKSVYFMGNVPEIWSKGVFSNTSPKLTIYYPEGNTSGWTSPTWKAPDGITYKTAVYTPEELPSDNILGDLSGDGTIDNDDVLVLQKYFAGHAVSIEPTLADVDEDGTITRRDAMILARYVAGWEGYTLPYVTEAYPFEQTYWVIFTEGFREDRVEASTIDSSIAAENLYLVWDTSLILSDRTGESTCKQYYLDENNRWVFMSDYHLLTDNATNVIASNLDIYDADGNLILEKCDYGDIDWEIVHSYK